MKNLLYSLIFLTFISCSNRQIKDGIDKYVNVNNNYQIDFYNKGNNLLRSVVFRDDEEGPDYYIAKYDTLTNTLIDSIPYINGKANGVRKLYLDSDKPSSIHYQYVDGIENGIRKSFYKNGEKYMVGNIIEGKFETNVFQCT